jgi:hypothetical protein
MTLANTVQEKLSSWQPPGDGRHDFGFVDAASGVAVRLGVEHLETLSCRLWEVSVTRPASPPLADWAKRVAEEATGLLEPLRVVEIDNARGQALLRSDEPARKSHDRFYYEVLLQATGVAHVRRFRGSTQPVKREQVSFILTREALAKLVEDIAIG